MIELLKLHVRREPASLRDPRMKGSSRMDRVLYRDAEASRQLCVYPWWTNRGPNRRSTRITINCWPFDLVWLSELPPR